MTGNLVRTSARSLAGISLIRISGKIIKSRFISAMLMSLAFSSMLACHCLIAAEDGTAVSGGKGVGVMSTRGFARTSILGKSEGKEAITSYRFELPYGVSAGWKLPYLGFSEGPKDSIQIKHVAVGIEQPGTPATRIQVKFGGEDGTLVAHDAVVESDPVDMQLLPGTVLTVSTFYRNQDPKGSLPFMTWGYADKIDGCLVGDIGTLKDDIMAGDSTYRGNQPPPPLWAGANALIRSYQPMFVTGKPHPKFLGTEVVIGFIGDSINIAQNDFGKAAAEDPFAARGWNGRFCGTKIPYVVFGQGGSNSGGFINAQGSPLFSYLFGTGADDRKVTHLVDAYGINAIRQPLKMKMSDRIWNDRQNVATIAKKLGIPYVHTTLTPMTSNWLVISKEPELGDAVAQFASFISERKEFNDRVRNQSNTIPGCVGFIDWGTAVETDPKEGSNLWQPMVGNDGIHPDAVGHQRMAAAVGNPFTAANPLPLKSASAK